MRASYMVGMTQKTQPLTAEQEAARKKKGAAGAGQFGEHARHDAEVTLAHQARVLGATGPETKIVMIAEGDGYVGYSPEAARQRLGIPESEPTSVVIDMVKLLGEDKNDDYPPYVAEEPTYELPGPDEDAVISTEEWYRIDPAIVWHETAEVWTDSSSAVVTVAARAVIDPDKIGWGEHRTALAAVVGERVAKAGAWDIVSDAVEEYDGKVQVPIVQEFAAGIFEPRIVSDRMDSLLEKANIPERIAEVKKNGLIISDKDMAASKDAPSSAVIYAVAHGRVPTDSEIVAVCRDYELSSTLQYGYTIGDPADELPEEDGEDEVYPVLREAITTWYDNRKNK